MSPPEWFPSQKSRKSRIQDGELNYHLRAIPRGISKRFHVSAPIVEKGIQTLIREDMSPNGVFPAVLILRTQLESVFATRQATVSMQLVKAQSLQPTHPLLRL